jgi:hypothetical protein
MSPRTETQVRFTRNASAPDFSPPPGIEVIELEDFTEGLSECPSTGCRNLLRAGFSQASVRQTWRPRRG